MRKVHSLFSVVRSVGLFMITTSLLLPTQSEAGDAKDPALEDCQGRLSVLILGDYYMPTFTSSNVQISTLKNASKFGAGLGIISEFTFGGPISLEAGLITLVRISEYQSTFATFSESSNWLTVPIGIKFRFTQFFAVGVGPYVGFRLNVPTQTFTIGTANASFNTDNRSQFEFGIQGAGSATIPITSAVGLLTEVRFLRGLNNIYGDQVTDLRSLDVIGALGLSFTY